MSDETLRDAWKVLAPRPDELHRLEARVLARWSQTPPSLTRAWLDLVFGSPRNLAWAAVAGLVILFTTPAGSLLWFATRPLLPTAALAKRNPCATPVTGVTSCADPVAWSRASP